MPSQYRTIPAIHRLLERESLRRAVERHGRPPVIAACRRAVDRLRRRIANGAVDDAASRDATSAIEAEALSILAETTRPAYRGVVNATGVLIHTNLGRSPLSTEGLDGLESYLALELDLATGRRGQRLAPLRQRIAELCGAHSAVMVNNNAAALLLILSALASGRQVIVSRGQLIEIGGSFRLPEVMAASGCRLVEVGCTNRTHLADYERALTDETGAILVAHQSNFRIVGFTTEPAISELAALARRAGVPLIVDQGSGCLHDLGRWGLPPEPTVQGLLAEGADLVCFSGDKLLGGPQAGIVVGAAEWVEPLGRHPLYRALRPDKTALVMMDRVLAAHRSGRLEEIPLYAMMSAPLDALARRARRLASRLRRAGVPARDRALRAALGGGTTPEETMPSHGLAVAGGQALADALRGGEPPVIGRLVEDEVLLDLRTVRPTEDHTLERALVEAQSRLSDLQASGR
ncbi:MAG: L-seryl-tRNA(Sec) selenium transferase [Thermoanaerobaculales bacterium]|jgi:L-seryl-tRNA(Ser) seleniumtransferase|nr:L-seryl-tRNA(Sec) selenium transferase [Thermoanaerobaculales bacterium]